MRKGYLLVEVLVVLIVLVMISATMQRFFRTLAYELPRGSKMVHENSRLLNVVKHIRTDVASAKALPASFDDYSADDVLLIELPEAVILYELADDRIHRRRLKSTEEHLSEDTVWSIPHGKIQWHIWRKGGNGYAVELQTRIEYRDRGLSQKKMANSYLFFIGLAGELAQ